jgi:hypothetical protein
MAKYRVVIVVLVCWLSSFLAFTTLWQHPGETLVSNGGDGIKNYYTPIWYALHDSSAHFSGMLYPYGDNYVFADAQPLLASAMQWYHTHVSAINGQDVVAVLNLAMVVSLMLCTLLMYLLLRENNLPWLYALVVAVLITLMSPQILRFQGHYGLSYAFAVPLVWLLSHYTLTKKYFGVWAALLAVSLVSLEFLHVYYLFVCGMFAGLYAAFGFLMNLKQWRGYLLRAGAIAIAVVFSFLAFQFWLSNTSEVIDRVAIPYGINGYKANFQSLFLPSYKPLIFGKHANWEGIAYVGFLGLPIIGFFLFKFSGYVSKFRFKPLGRLVLPAPLQTAVWPSVIIMLFSTGFPIILLLDWLPDAVKQFRSLGRFAWVFYYVYTTLGAFTLYQLYRYLGIKGARKVGIYILLMALCIWGYEVQLFLRPIQKTIAENYKYHTAQDLLTDIISAEDLAKHDLLNHKYQAIMPLPFFMAGSEKLGTNVDGRLFYRCIQTSFQLHMPMVACNMSRTSLAHTAKVWQLFAAPVIERTYIADLNGDTRPFLLIYNGTELSTGEQTMLQAAELLFTIGNTSFYNLPVAALQPKGEDYYAQFEAAKDSLLTQGEMLVSKSGYYYEQDYDDQPNQLGMFQSGALTSVNDTIWMAKGLDIAASADTLEVSFWIKIDPKFWGMGEVFGLLSGEGTEQSIYLNPSEFWDAYNGWLRVSVKLNPTKAPAKLDLLLKGHYQTADQLMIKPLQTVVYKPTTYADTVLYNNYFIYPR